MRRFGWIACPLLCIALAYAAGTRTYRTASGFVLQVTDRNAAEVELTLNGSYKTNVCEIETGPLPIKNGTVSYRPSDEPACSVQVRFRGAQAVVTQKGICGCGLNVNLSGTYKKRAP